MWIDLDILGTYIWMRMNMNRCTLHMRILTPGWMAMELASRWITLG